MPRSRMGSKSAELRAEGYEAPELRWGFGLRVRGLGFRV